MQAQMTHQSASVGRGVARPVVVYDQMHIELVWSCRVGDTQRGERVIHCVLRQSSGSQAKLIENRKIVQAPGYTALTSPAHVHGGRRYSRHSDSFCIGEIPLTDQRDACAQWDSPCDFVMPYSLQKSRVLFRRQRGRLEPSTMSYRNFPKVQFWGT